MPEALPQDIITSATSRVEVPGLKLTVGYFTQVTGFSSQTDVLEYAEGGRNDFVHRLPSRTKQGNITLKRGVTARRR